MLTLEQRRLVLQAELDALTRELQQLSAQILSNGAAAHAPAPTERPPAPKRGRRKGSRRSKAAAGTPLESPAPVSAVKAVATPVKAAKGKKRAKRGQLSANILSELKSAGSKGVTVADLASKLGADYKNIYVWFATTGKNRPGVKKIAPATYKLA